jgi:hypothetical protein
MRNSEESNSVKIAWREREGWRDGKRAIGEKERERERR